MSRIFATYAGRVPASVDLVCYWFEKAGRQIASGKAARVGLVATNSIRGGANRRALQAATTARRILEAWSDEPWVIDGAAVRVSLVCFSRIDDRAGLAPRLDGVAVDEIHADLTARRDGVGIDLTNARCLPKNASASFKGDEKGGPFNVPGDLTREWLCLPANPNGQTNADVLKLWINGMDVTRRPADKWIVDFGSRMSEGEAALYEEPFQWLKERVYPIRQQNRVEANRVYWYRHRRPSAGHVARAPRHVAVPRDGEGRQAPAVRLVRRAHLPGLAADRHRPRRRHDLRHPATAGSTRSGRSGWERAWKTVRATRRARPSRRFRSRPT